MRKVILYIILFIAMLFAYRWFIYAGIKKNKLGIFNKYNEVFVKKNNTYSALFMGSSRAEMHFNPTIFDSITHLNSYNFGMSGASLKLSYGLLKTYCNQHKKPKYLILNIDYFGLQNDSDKINDFSRYLPYLQNTYLKNELTKLEPRFPSLYYNPLHSIPYTQTKFLSASLHGWLSIYGKYDTLMYKGFQTTESNEVRHIEKSIPKYSIITVKNRKYIDSLILFTKLNNIELTLITTPVFGGANQLVINKSRLLNQIQNIAFINKLVYLNYSDSLICRNRYLFDDIYHLNLKGANQFTASFSEVFIRTYKNKLRK